MVENESGSAKTTEQSPGRYPLTPIGSTSPEVRSIGNISVPEIYDVTLRDGEQQPGVAFTVSEKLEIFRALRDAGVPYVETGMAAASDLELETARQAVGEAGTTKVALLCRSLAEDVDKALATGVHLVTIETIVNPEFAQRVFGWDRDQAIGRAVSALERARDDGVEANLFLLDATRVRASDLAGIVSAIWNACEFRRVIIADTFGVADPTATREYVTACRDSCDAVIGVHFHNDLGLAVANSIEGLRCGATHVHTSINGMGERAGNAATEDLVMALAVLFGIDSGVTISALRGLSALVAERSGFQPAANKSVVGAELFDIESGVATACYERLMDDLRWFYCYTPEAVNAVANVVQGKGAGGANIRLLATEYGIDPETIDIDRILATVKRIGAVSGAPLDSAWVCLLMMSSIAPNGDAA